MASDRSPAGPKPLPPEADRAAYPILLQHPIRYNDTDRQGHVNNAAFVTYFEVGRTEFSHAVAPELLPPGAETILARLEIDYRKELFFPGKVEIAIAVRAIGTSSVRLAQAVFHDGVCAASGTTVLVLADAATSRPRPWSEEQRALLTRYMLQTSAG